MLRTSECLLKKWLEIDYNRIARRAGFTCEYRDVTSDLVYETMRFLDSETIMNKQPNRNDIIAIIALMWEHTDREIYDLKDICIKFLSRIGYPASAIICDKGFDEKECNFSPTHSALDGISRSFFHACNEVSIQGNNYLLTDFQKEIWRSMDEEKVIGISAPTSAGKSFVLLLKLVDRLAQEKIDVVYIVPTLSLVNQVTEDFNKMLKKIRCSNCRIVNVFEAGKRTEHNHIYVLTQERAVAAFLNSELAFTYDLILVADEIQNIERINQDGAERSRVLYDTLIEFRHMKNVKQIIIAGPRIENIGKIGKNLFGSKSKAHETSISPVLNITYSINKVANKFFFKQYTTLLKEPIVHEISDSSNIIGYGKKKYTDAYLQYFQEFVKCTGGQQNIIFAPTAQTARVMATSMEVSQDNLVIQEELIDYYRETIHEKYALCDAMKKGIAYHHGRLPVHVRRTLERAITEKKISNIVCTTTLLQGVNLPAQNVYIRNPHLYVKKVLNATELTSYEMANLRGRAGRLLKDFVGRTFVMDESEFVDTDGYEQETLFEDTTKELPSNYEAKFEDVRRHIVVGANCILFSVYRPTRLCRIGTYRRF